MYIIILNVGTGVLSKIPVAATEQIEGMYSGIHPLVRHVMLLFFCLSCEGLLV